MPEGEGIISAVFRAEHRFRQYRPLRACSDSVEKPSFIDTEHRVAALMDACAELRGELSAVRDAVFFGESTSIRALFHAVHDAAPADAPVLITGEIGVGKT
jgi:DNA-binding NtrC family response regulator